MFELIKTDKDQDAVELALLEASDGGDCGITIEETIHAGIYCREMNVPKGIVISGATHKKDGYAVLSKGEMTISDHGETTHIIAPCTVRVMAGSRKLGYAIEDSTFLTFHHVECTDIKDAEAELFDMSHGEKLGLTKLLGRRI